MRMLEWIECSIMQWQNYRAIMWQLKLNGTRRGWKVFCECSLLNMPPKQSCMNKALGITPDVKVLIRGLNSTTVIRLLDEKTTCGKLKSELGVSRIMSSGKSLKDDHTFMNNEIIHALGRLRGGMEVNFI